MEWRSEYFYGNKVSEYGLQKGYVDYRTLAKAFDAVLNNDIMSLTSEIGFWECETEDYYYEDSKGNIFSSEEKEEKVLELEEEIEKLEESEPDESDFSDDDNGWEEYQKACSEWEEKIDSLRSEIDTLEEVHYEEFFQYYIVSDNGAKILKEAGETVWYNETLDMYLWGVTHWGTSWDYVLTNIRIVKED